MTFKGIHHIALVTADMDETIRFWRDLLGMRLAGGKGSEKYKQYFFQVSDECYISFFQWQGVEPIDEKDAGVSMRGKIAFDHICFEVPDQDTLYSIKMLLEEKDIWVSEVVDNGFIHSMFTFDPNNISVEFCIKASGPSLAQNPHLADSAPPITATTGPDPSSILPPPAFPPQEDRSIYPGALVNIFKLPDFWKQ